MDEQEMNDLLVCRDNLINDYEDIIKQLKKEIEVLKKQATKKWKWII